MVWCVNWRELGLVGQELVGVVYSEEGMCFSRFEGCKLWYGTRSGRRAGFY